MPDVGFRLFGDSTSIERAASRGKSAINNLEKEVKGVNKVIGTLGKVSGAFGLVQAFGAALDNAQKLRDESEKNKTSLDATTAAAARYADTIDSVKEGVAALSAKSLGFFAMAGEGWAKIYTRITKGQEGLDDFIETEERMAAGEKNTKDILATSKVQVEVNKAVRDYTMETATYDEKRKVIVDEIATSLKKMDDTSKSREDRKKAELDVDTKMIELSKLETERKKEIATAEAAASAASKKVAFEKLSEENKIIQLRKEALDLEKQSAAVGLDKVKSLELQKSAAEKIADANEREARRKEETDRAKKEIGVGTKGVVEARTNLETAQRDRASLSLGELANISPFASGVSTDISNQGRTAREVMDIEGKAKTARLAGDVQGAQGLFSKADELRGGLTALKSADKDPLATYKDALKESEQKLEDIKTAVQGWFINK